MTPSPHVTRNASSKKRKAQNMDDLTENNDENTSVSIANKNSRPVIKVDEPESLPSDISICSSLSATMISSPIANSDKKSRKSKKKLKKMEQKKSKSELIEELFGPGTDDIEEEETPPPRVLAPKKINQLVKNKGLKKMTNEELVHDQGTLLGGMSLFRQIMTNELNAKEFEDRLQGVTSRPEEEDEMPKLDSSNRSENESLCSEFDRSPETNLSLPVKIPLRKLKPKKALKQEAKGSSDEENIDNTILLTDCDEAIEEEEEEDDDSDSEIPVLEKQVTAEELARGEAQFGELFRRLDKPKREKLSLESEFNLADQNQVNRNIFSDYDEKEKLYEIHRRNIQTLTPERIKREFKQIKEKLLDIFTGEATCNRMKLYLTKNKEDELRLKALNVSDPFLTQDFMKIANKINNLLLPNVQDRLMYTEFVRLVMVPEALIMIYKNVNNISYSQAEREMKFGPRYDAPLPKKQKKEMRLLQKSST